MNYVAYIVLRRLRAPLITLIVIYSMSVLGYVLIPGVDSEGEPYRMNFFHAFYFVSYMGSTIGFGELPLLIEINGLAYCNPGRGAVDISGV